MSSPSVFELDESNDDTFPAAMGISGAFAGLVLGIVLSAVVGAIVFVAGDYSSSIPGGQGAAIGRAVAQTSTESALESRRMPIALLGLLQVPLWLGLVGAPVLVSRLAGRGFAEDLRFRFAATDIGTGLAVGVLSQLVLLPALYWPIFRLIGERDLSGSARSLTDQAEGDPVGVIVLVLMVVVAAPLVEELFFRGFLQRSLHRRFGFVPAWLIASAVFGAVHFQVLQFPALMAFGLVAGALFAKYDRLGPAIWAHVGFNTVTVIALLVL